MGKGQMRLLIISPAQVMMDPGSAALWHWEGTETDFFILSSQHGPKSGGCVFFFFSGPMPPSIFWSGHSCWVVNISGRREWPRFHLISPKHTHKNTHTHTYAPPPLFCITLIGAQRMQALPDPPLLSLCLSLSVSLLFPCQSHISVTLSRHFLSPSVSFQLNWT